MGKLYEMEAKRYLHQGVTRGFSWRSDHIFVCQVCHTKTNYWVMGGWPGYGPRLLCNGEIYKEHDELESAFKKCSSLEKKIKEFEKLLQISSDINQENGKSLIKNLSAEKELLEFKIKKLRGLFSGKADDIAGIDIKNAEWEYFYPDSHYAGTKKTLN
jgi:hypothetical protein